MKQLLEFVIDRAFIKSSEKISALYMPYDGKFEWLLKDMPLELYSSPELIYRENRSQKWPDNIYWLGHKLQYIPNRLDIDLIFCNHINQINTANALAQNFHLPIVFFNHELPQQSSRAYTHYTLDKLDREYIHFVYPHESYRQAWDHEGDRVFVFPYSFPQVEALEREQEVVVLGDFHENDQYLIDAMLSVHPDAIGLGYNNNMTPYQDIDEVVAQLQKTRLCLTATEPKLIPFWAMLATSCGCQVITNKTPASVPHQFSLFENVGEINKRVKEIAGEVNTKQFCGSSKPFSQFLKQVSRKAFTK